MQMKLFGKLILCLLAIALAGYLFLVDYPALLASLNEHDETTYTSGVQENNNTDQTADTDETVDSQENLTASLEEQATSLEAELEELYQQCGTTSVALCFDQISEVVYDDIYPVLSSYGETGTLVFNNGWLTGDNGRVQTSEFRTMMEDGWSYAIGGDAALELTGTEEEIVAAWQANLEEYMERIRVRTGVVPTIYCFQEGEYLSAYEEILAEAGFTAIRYFPEDATEGSGESELQRVVGILITEDTQTDELLESLQTYPGAVLAAYVVDGEDYDEDQITLTSYLALLEELRTIDSISVSTLDAAMAAATDEEQWTLRVEIQEKEAALEEIKAQMTDGQDNP
ncbi:MAG: polysaccharide deacetylase family protein [Lachnospiraceae bacterium]|nr:polysaccharide deacetylase family protein [Lachnospiraceae bacterium]